MWASSPAGGMPLFSSAQPAVLYPLNLLWILLPIGAGLAINMALKLWLAGLGMWFFLRALSLHPAASFMGAIGFMFSAWMVNWVTWAHTNVYLLIPWFALAAYAWCVQGKRMALVWLALLVACAIFGGHPESTFIIGAAIAVWCVGLLAGTPLSLVRDRLIGLAVAGTVGLLIGCVQLLPFAQELEGSHASVARPADSTALAGMHVETGAALDWVLPRTWGHFSEGVLGDPVSFTAMNPYVGLVAVLGLILAAVAAVRREMRYRMVAPWLVVGILGWILTYDGSGIATFLRALPIVRQVNGAYWVCMSAFAVLVIGAAGWDWFAREVERRAGNAHKRAGLLGIAGGLLVVAGVAVMLAHMAGLFPQPVMRHNGPFFQVNESYRAYWAIWAAGVLLVLLGATAIWWAGPGLPLRYRNSATTERESNEQHPRNSVYRSVGWPSLIIMIVLVADLWRLLFSVNRTAPANEYYPQTSFLQQVKAIVPATGRLIAEGNAIPADSGMVFGIRDWRVQDPMLSERAHKAATFLSPHLTENGWDDYNMFLGSVRLPVAPILGISYFILPRGVDPNKPDDPDPGRPNFTRLALKDGLGLWQAEGVPDFAYLTDNVQAAAGEKEAAQWMEQLTWEQTRAYAAVVEAPAAQLESIQKGHSEGSPGNVVVTGYTPGHIQLEAHAFRPALAVISESWYKGWRASLDGQPVETLRANYLSQGVMVPAGTHTLELQYTPGAFRYGSILSLLGILGVFGLTFWVRRRETVRG